MTGKILAYDKILFCILHLICNLAGEFNGLVSKRAGCFYIRPFYAPLPTKAHLKMGLMIDYQYFTSLF